jgi:hypothetical protein
MRERLQDILDIIALIERCATRGREAFEADELHQTISSSISRSSAKLLGYCRKKSVPRRQKPWSQITGHWPRRLNAGLNFRSFPSVITE